MSTLGRLPSGADLLGKITDVVRGDVECARESLRRSYRPERVRLLFVGEAPPASGVFFYQRDSGLYRALSSTFEEVFPRLRGCDFLTEFRDLGCYLVDLCARPVDRLGPRERRQARRSGEVGFAEVLRELRPPAMVVLLRSIEENAARAERIAGWGGERLVVPYPGRWVQHRTLFRDLLVPALRRWTTEGLLGEG